MGCAVARGEVGDVAGGLATLAEIAPAAVADYSAYWVARAHSLRLDRQVDAARAATERAIRLTEDPRLVAHLAGSG